MRKFLENHWASIFFLTCITGFVWFASWRIDISAREVAKARAEFHNSLTTEERDFIVLKQADLIQAVKGSLIVFRVGPTRDLHGKIVRVTDRTDNECVVFKDKYRMNVPICPDNEKGLLAIEKVVLGPSDPQYAAVAFEYWTQKYVD